VYDAVWNAAQRNRDGSRLSRAAIQPPCCCAKSRASRTLPRGGMVSTTSREGASMRSV
jgi:hypothetical protein